MCPKVLTNVIKLPIFSFIGNNLLELFGKKDNWHQVHKQTSSSFYAPKDLCLENNVLKKILNI